MKKLFLIIAIMWFPKFVLAQNKKDVEAVLHRQQTFWNQGNIDAFMQDYWHSDSLMFIGRNGVVLGYDATKARYHKSYPSAEAMGELNFDIQKIEFYSEKTAWVLGKWQLKRKVSGNVGGYFTLILKFIDGKWQIVSDHTS